MEWFRPVDDDWNAPEADDEASWCLHCGKSLADFTTAYIRYYCSIECRNAAERDRRREKCGPPCVVCGKPVAWRASRPGKFCSSACYGEAIRTRPRQPIERTCPICEIVFTVRSSTEKKRCCSVQCAGTFKRKYLLSREERRAAARAGRSCIECGKPINATRHDMHYCGNQCRQAAYRKRKRARKQASAFMCEAAE